MADKSSIKDSSLAASASKSTRNKSLKGASTLEKCDNNKSEKMEFIPGSMLEARDFNNEWFSAKIVEVDQEDREVLVHFQNWSSRYDEWISMESARLRPVTVAQE